jgi:polygalacturonase
MRVTILKTIICLLLIWAGISCSNQTSSYNILDFGARGDGKTMNTKAINKAVEICNKKGGGTVLIPPGTFVTGTVVLLSNVNFNLEPGAILIGSRDTSDYLKMESTLFEEGYNRFGMICAVDAKNISITGSGEINGNGTSFMNGLDKPHMGGHDYDRKFIRQGEQFMKPGTVFEDGPVSYSFRPGLMITIERSENIRISDVILKDSPEWTIRIGDCDDAEVRGISILNNKVIPNNDGIHVTTSRNVRISDCNIFAGDDAIIVTGFGNSPLPDELLSGKRKPLDVGNKTGIAENVTVTNCVLSSRSACIRVGYGSHPIRNLVFSNLVMYESNRGIGVFARDNSSIEKVLFSNIIINNRIHSGHWWGKGEPIHISSIRDTEKGRPGTIKNIRFSDISATSETGIVIFGLDNSVIETVLMENIRLTINKGKYTESYGGNIDLRPAYPLEYAIFKHDIPGLIAQYVNHLTISGFELNWGDDLPSFFTHGVEIDHFNYLILDDIKADPAPSSVELSAIKLSYGQNAELRNCSTRKGTVLLKKEMVK